MNWSVQVSFCVSILFLFFTVSAKVHFHGYKVYRVYVDSKNDFYIFAHLAAENNDELDIWHYGNEPQLYLDILVKPSFSETFHEFLTQRQFNSLALIEDVEKLINQSSRKKIKRHVFKKSKRREALSAGFSLKKYNSLHDIYSWLKQLNQSHKDIVSLTEIGRSYEDRPIFSLKIGKESNHKLKPAIWIDAGIHSREWLSIGTAIYIISEFVHKYKANEPRVRYLLDQVDFYIAPVINPDGYLYSRKTHRLWRKTRSQVGNVTNAKGKMCVGVDANRNFDHFWGSVREYGDEHPCSDGYPGKKPSSESETVAIADHLKKLQYKLLAYITLHSYGQMWLAPWGYDSLKPANYQRQRDVALRAIDALQSVHGTPYSYGTVSDLLYPASGTSIDYAYSLNITYSYAIELRPGEAGAFDSGFRGFLYPENQIIPTGEETFAAILALAEETFNEHKSINRQQ